MINLTLPRIDTPTYQTNLPSTGQSVQFRPFLVKEQKGNHHDGLKRVVKNKMVRALSELVTACTFNKIDVANSPTFDVEVSFFEDYDQIVCGNCSNNIVCPDDEVTQVSTKIDLDQIESKHKRVDNNVIDITDTVHRWFQISYTFRYR